MNHFRVLGLGNKPQVIDNNMCYQNLSISLVSENAFIVIRPPPALP